MKPAILLNDFNGGGAERLVKDLSIALDRRDDVDPVVVASESRGELEAAFRSSPVELRVLGAEVTMGGVAGGVTELVSCLREREVDVVHSHLAFSDLIGRLACARLSLPHVSTYHNVEEKRPALKQVVEHATRRLSDRILCVSEGVRQSYGNHPRMSVVYNAIDVAGFARRVEQANQDAVPPAVREAETVFLNVGRCVEVKRQWDLITAVEQLDASDCHLVIVGDGPQRPELEALVAERGLSEQVTVTGFVESVEPYYAVADAFVSASGKEGLPTTHIEAMAAALPVVSTDIPGVRELVADGTTGYLSPVGEPGTLADLLERVHRRGCQTLGRRGYQAAESTFAIEQIAAEHASLYREVTTE
ncbi:glycosyltransferase [Haloarcula salinisoli]|uniref:Glycosyltransferase n=1 Tax=Haloarcula salinisoli TaxID=2487746 RepID=A0A8J7YHX8_9EURY|nr:glycosyltransferase [Halomicroarcula salinisoli]MBX0288390.1 glycosyltransferase [Halomicroarcula salinisoli]MBX0305872.1 glycosyltransferase [Halomicroarcula salinisoli]